MTLWHSKWWFGYKLFFFCFPSERAALETQRQEREEALITARAELKDLDLEEVDLESKIRAANEEIKLRTTQDEKVKEEMTNLKAGEW